MATTSFAFLFFVLIVVTTLLPSCATQIRVACLGDSITRSGACLQQSYVDVLKELLGSKYEVVNAGHRGAAMMQHGLLTRSSRLSYWNTSEWQEVLHSKFDIAVTMFGTNDAKTFNWDLTQLQEGDFFVLDYIDLIKQLQQLNPNIQIFVAIPPPIYQPFLFQINDTVLNDILPHVLRRMAQVMRLPIIDIHTTIANQLQISYSSNTTDNGHSINGDHINHNKTSVHHNRDNNHNKFPVFHSLLCDGVHPTELANKLMAEAVSKSILSASPALS